MAEFFRTDVDRRQTRASLCIRGFRQKADNEFAGIESLAIGERIARHHVAHFGEGAKNYSGTKAVTLLNTVFNAFGELVEIALRGAKHNVAALDVGLRPSQLKRKADFTQRLHADFVAPAYIDAAKQANDHSHGRVEYKGKACRSEAAHSSS